MFTFKIKYKFLEIRNYLQLWKLLIVEVLKDFQYYFILNSASLNVSHLRYHEIKKSSQVKLLFQHFNSMQFYSF